MLLSLLLACHNQYFIRSNDNPDSGQDIFIETPTQEELIFIIEWQDEGLSVQVNIEASFILGIVETGNAAYDPWTGEDCLYGYYYDGTQILYCHPLQSGTNWFFDAADPLSLDITSETVFTREISNELTYAIWSTETDNCWVWGDDPYYYREESCTEISQSTGN